MDLPDHFNEPGGASKLGYGLAQLVAADVVKGFSEIHEGGIETNIVLLELLLLLVGCEDRVGRASACAESALTLRKHIVL